MGRPVCFGECVSREARQRLEVVDVDSRSIIRDDVYLNALSLPVTAKRCLSALPAER